MTTPESGTQEPTAASVSRSGASHPALEPAPRKDTERHRPRNPRDAHEELDRTRQEIRDTLKALKQRARREGAEVADRLNVLARVRERIREDPLLLLGAAAGAGLLLGLITGGERRLPQGILTQDEIDEILAWRAERRRYLRRLERIMEDTARGGRAPLHERLRERIRGPRDDGDE